MQVASIQRKTPVLTPSRLACLAKIPTVNLTAGCAHGCLYCYARGYAAYPGDGKVLVYADTAARLLAELARKRKLPRAVYFSPSSDLFQPVPLVLDLAYEVLSMLFERGVGAAILTKGAIPEPHMRLLEAHAPLVRAQVGLNTLDDALARLFEPGAPAPAARLAQVRRLAAAGIETQVRLDPILPGLTDTAATLEPLCSSLATAGVKEIAASMLFLRGAVARSLARLGKGVRSHKTEGSRPHFGDATARDTLLGQFAAREYLRIRAENSTVYALPAADRRRTYALVSEIAARHGLTVHVCGCKNPDLGGEACGIAGAWPETAREKPSLWSAGGVTEKGA
jgi:DNA repair photolyase